MTKHIVFRIVAALVLLAAIAGIGYFAYTAGVARGAASDVQLTTVPAEGLAYPHFYGMHPFFGMGCFVPLAILFLVCLAFGSMRRMVWGPRWGWRRWHHGPMGMGPDDCKGRGPWGESVPPFFAEWHKRAHEGPEEPAEKKAE